MCGLLLVGIAWVPGRIDRLEARLDRVEDLSAQVSVMHSKLSDLDKLEKKLSETALDAAPLGRIDSSVDEVAKKLNQVMVPAINDIKGRIVSRSDLNSLLSKIDQMSRRLAEASKADPEMKKLAKGLQELKRSVEESRKTFEATSRSVNSISKDVKSLHLELQKLEALIKQSGGSAQAAQP